MDGFCQVQFRHWFPCFDDETATGDAAVGLAVVVVVPVGTIGVQRLRSSFHGA